jgi:hypothetical protein
MFTRRAKETLFERTQTLRWLPWLASLTIRLGKRGFHLESFGCTVASNTGGAGTPALDEESGFRAGCLARIRGGLRAGLRASGISRISGVAAWLSLGFCGGLGVALNLGGEFPLHHWIVRFQLFHSIQMRAFRVRAIPGTRSRQNPPAQSGRWIYFRSPDVNGILCFSGRAKRTSSALNAPGVESCLQSPDG